MSETTSTTIKRKTGRPRKNATSTSPNVDDTQINPSPAAAATVTTDQVQPIQEEQPILTAKEQKEQFEISKCTYTKDNYIVEYKQNSEVIKFLLLTAIKAIKSGRAHIVFEPLPYAWQQYIKQQQSKDSTRLELGLTIDIKQVVKDLKINLDLETLVSTVQTSYTDLEIIEKVGEATYGFIKFVLMSNNTFIKPYSLLTSADVITVSSKDTSEGQITSAEMSASVQQYKVIHTPLKEDQFKETETFYLYHGTRIENVFSIMRNGLQCGSKSGGRSKYFLNGNAYGDGTYFSNDIYMSLGYSNGTTTTSQSDTSQSDTLSAVLFIFEVKKNPDKKDWHKSGNIYVVDEEDAYILRYILNFNNSKQVANQAIFTAINRKLNEGKLKDFEKKTQEIEKRNITTIHNKRLMREFAMIKKQDPQVLGFNTLLAEEDNLKVWTIQLFRPDNAKLEEQMRRIGIPHIEIEITFKENYPIEPPFIRVVHPHFKFRSGHITMGGSLCMEMLTNQGWSPTLNVENIITQIKMAISDGGGEIDEAHWNTRYSKAEAIEAFKRVLATHGWV